jgi:hypothetical protein
MDRCRKNASQRIVFELMQTKATLENDDLLWLTEPLAERPKED